MSKDETPTPFTDATIRGRNSSRPDWGRDMVDLARSLERDRADLLALLRYWQATGIHLREHLPDNDLMEKTAALLGRIK